eukprot:3066432-Alexandrium_andersonii.AAC.1
MARVLLCRRSSSLLLPQRQPLISGCVVLTCAGIVAYQSRWHTPLPTLAGAATAGAAAMKEHGSH